VIPKFETYSFNRSYASNRVLLSNSAYVWLDANDSWDDNLTHTTTNYVDAVQFMLIHLLTDGFPFPR